MLVIVIGAGGILITLAIAGIITLWLADRAVKRQSEAAERAWEESGGGLLVTVHEGPRKRTRPSPMLSSPRPHSHRGGRHAVPEVQGRAQARTPAGQQTEAVG